MKTTKNRNYTKKGNILLIGLMLTSLWTFEGCGLIEGEEEVSKSTDYYEKPILDLTDVQSLVVLESTPNSGDMWIRTTEGNLEKMDVDWKVKGTGAIEETLDVPHYFQWWARQMVDLSDDWLMVDGHFSLYIPSTADTLLNRVGGAVFINKKTGDIYPIQHPGGDYELGSNEYSRILRSSYQLGPGTNQLTVSNGFTGIVRLDYSDPTTAEVTEVNNLMNSLYFDISPNGAIYSIDISGNFVVVGPSGEAVDFGNFLYWKGSNSEIYFTEQGKMNGIYHMVESSETIDSVKVADLLFLGDDSPFLWDWHSYTTISVPRNGSVILVDSRGGRGMEYFEETDTLEFFELPDFDDSSVFALSDTHLYVGSGSNLYRLDLSDRSLSEFVSESPYEFLHLMMVGNQLYFSGERKTDRVIVTGVIGDNGEFTIVYDQLDQVVKQIVELN